MTPAIARVRGRASAAVKLAWLKVGGEWVCSTDNTRFELMTNDGARVRVGIDIDTSWNGFTRHLIGAGPDDDGFDTEHPFRGRADLHEATEYLAIFIPAQAELEAWGVPEFATTASTYRDHQPGSLASLAALHISPRGAGDEKLESRLGAGILLALALGFGIAATITHAELARVALLFAIASLRGLHRASSPLGPPQPIPKHVVLENLLVVWFWAYCGLAYVIPGSGPFRLAAGILLAIVLTRWGVSTRREGRVAIMDALLSPEAVDGIVHRDSVLLPTATLAPNNIATSWTSLLAGWQKTAIAAMSNDGFERAFGDYVRAAHASAGWVVARSHRPTIVAALRRARAWERVMPFAYFTLAAATLALLAS